jgi:hypothetical protein
MKILTATLCVLQMAFVIPTRAANDTFNVRVTKVKRVKDGCVASVESDKVRFEISSDVSGACTMLRVGEEYKARLSSARPQDKVAANDDSADTTILEIFNNIKSPNVRDNSAFDVESQELLKPAKE